MQNCVAMQNGYTYLGANDRRIALFESAFPVPKGISYNSYLLTDEKTALFDTADRAVCEQFLENLAYALQGRDLDYLIISHMEPDHSASLSAVFARYPAVKVVVNQKSAVMLKNFCGEDLPELIVVKEGDTLSTGSHLLRFLLAPMVHWPEVMFTFDESTGTLFSADAFGAFGALPALYADEVDFEREFLDEARRYYFNIVGKYGLQVQSVLKKATALEIKTICPLHGPVWRKDFASYLAKYNTWSSYLPEEKGVAVFYASVYGHTQNAAETVASALAARNIPVKVYDVSANDASYLLAEAFRYSHAVFASTTYNNQIFVSMERLLNELASHAYQNRAFALIENGSWAPQAAKLMREKLGNMKNMREAGAGATVLSAVNEASREQLLSLAQAVAEDYNN